MRTMIREQFPLSADVPAPEPGPDAPAVLLVDAWRVDRLLLRALLTFRGPERLKVTEAADLDLALGLLNQRRFDLVLLNAALPGVTPAEALRAVASAAPGTTVIRHSDFLGKHDGAADPADPWTCADEAGDLQALLAAVREALERAPRNADRPAAAGRGLA